MNGSPSIAQSTASKSYQHSKDSKEVEEWCLDTLARLLGRKPLPSEELEAQRRAEAALAPEDRRRPMIDYDSINRRLEKRRQKELQNRREAQKHIMEMSTLEYQMDALLSGTADVTDETKEPEPALSGELQKALMEGQQLDVETALKLQGAQSSSTASSSRFQQWEKSRMQAQQFQQILETAGLLTHKAYTRTRNTPFMRYLRNGVFVVDVANQDREILDLVFAAGLRIPNIQFLKIVDSDLFRRERLIQGANGSLASTTTSAGATSSSSRSVGGNTTGKVKDTPTVVNPNRLSDKEVLSALAAFIPRIVTAHARTLRYIEFIGITFSSWRPIVDALLTASSLRAFYMRRCTIPLQGLVDITQALSVLSINHVAFSECDLPPQAADWFVRLLTSQSRRRDEYRWRASLRTHGPSTCSAPAACRQAEQHQLENSTAMTLATTALSAKTPLEKQIIDRLLHQGLITLDISNNSLGDEGVASIIRTLASDEWLLAIDVSGNNCDVATLDAVVKTLYANTQLIAIKLDDPSADSSLVADAASQRVGRRSPSPAGTEGGRSSRSSDIPTGSLSKTDRLLSALDPFAPLRFTRLMALYASPGTPGFGVTLDNGHMRLAHRMARRAILSRSYWHQQDSQQGIPSRPSLDLGGVTQPPPLGKNGGRVLFPLLTLVCDDTSVLEPLMHLRNSGKLRGPLGAAVREIATITVPKPKSAGSTAQARKIRAQRLHRLQQLLTETKFDPSYIEAFWTNRRTVREARIEGLVALRRSIESRLRTYAQYIGKRKQQRILKKVGKDELDPSDEYTLDSAALGREAEAIAEELLYGELDSAAGLGAGLGARRLSSQELELTRLVYAQRMRALLEDIVAPAEVQAARKRMRQRQLLKQQANAKPVHLGGNGESKLLQSYTSGIGMLGGDDESDSEWEVNDASHTTADSSEDGPHQALFDNSEVLDEQREQAIEEDYFERLTRQLSKLTLKALGMSMPEGETATQVHLSGISDGQSIARFERIAESVNAQGATSNNPVGSATNKVESELAELTMRALTKAWEEEISEMAKSGSWSFEIESESTGPSEGGFATAGASFPVPHDEDNRDDSRELGEDLARFTLREQVLGTGRTGYELAAEAKVLRDQRREAARKFLAEQLGETSHLAEGDLITLARHVADKLHSSVLQKRTAVKLRQAAQARQMEELETLDSESKDNNVSAGYARQKHLSRERAKAREAPSKHATRSTAKLTHDEIKGSHTVPRGSVRSESRSARVVQRPKSAGAIEVQKTTQASHNTKFDPNDPVVRVLLDKVKDIAGKCPGYANLFTFWLNNMKMLP